MKIESQMDNAKKNLSESPINDMGLPQSTDDFNPNSTQTNALLSIRDNQFNLILQQVYYSEKCSWFYIGLLVLSFGLILVTIFDGFQVAESPMFIVLEFILNLLIGIDFACRIKLVGCHKYVKDPASGKIRCWNIFDALVVTICNSVFAISLFSKTGAIKGLEEASEEGLIVMWCIWQTLRMILIAKKQRLARQSAKTLINFENIVVDTDFGGALSFRSMAVDGGRANLSGDPDDIVIELAKTGKDGVKDNDEESKRTTDLNNKARLRSKINAGRTGFGRAASGTTKADDFNNINHYVIDDEEDEDDDEEDSSQQDSQRSEEQKNDSQNKSVNSLNTTPREIVFEIEDE